MSKPNPTYEELQRRVAQLEFRLRQIESRDYIVKANDAELQALNVDYEVVFRNTNFYVAFYRPNGEIVAFNKIAAEEFGQAPEELVGKKVWDLFDKEMADLFYSRMQKAISDRKVVSSEEYNTTKYGKSWYETDYIPVFDEDKEIVGCQVIARDVGDKKNAIEKLEESRELFKSVFEQSNAGIAIINRDYKFIDVNQRFAEMLGYTVDEILKLPLQAISYDKDSKVEDEIIQKVIKGEIDEYKIEKRYIKKNGDLFWANLSSNVVRDQNGNALYSVGVIVNIQDLKDARAAWAISENKYRTLVENQIEGVVMSSKDEGFLFANCAAEKIFGVGEGQLLNRSLVEFLPKESVGKVKNETSKRAQGISSSYKIDINRPDGKRVHLFVHAIPHKDAKGNFIGTLAFFRDITRQMQAEKKLEESNYRYQSVLENTSEGVFVIKNGAVVYANKAVKNFTGYSNYDQNQNSFFEIIHPDDKEIVIKNYESRLKGDIIPPYDIRILTIGKEYRWFIINAVRIEWEGELADLVFAQDIHERKNAEIELKQKTEELERLNNTKNRLLSIIGHDLRSPLSNINGFVYLIEKKFGAKIDDKIKKYINVIYQSSNTLSEILDNLLEWSRAQTHVLKVNISSVDLNELVEQNIRHYIHNAKIKDIQLKNETEKGVSIKADKSMLNTIIRNLISNAIKFTNREGTVTISCFQSEKHSKLIVEDTGIGLSQKVLDEILNAKTSGNEHGTEGEKGTGLGLQIIQEMVGLHNGRFGVKENGKQGTTFYVEFPNNVN